jgi:hypothetical protein
MAMVKVKMVNNASFIYEAGCEYEVCPEVADRFAALKVADMIEDPVPNEKRSAKKKPAPKIDNKMNAEAPENKSAESGDT